MSSARARNLKTLGSLRADPREEALWEATVKDAGLGRMSHPLPVSDLDLDVVLLIKRFGVAHGEWAAARAFAGFAGLARMGAGEKVRPIDDCTAAMINAATSKCEKMRPDTIDHLYELARLLFREAKGAVSPRAPLGP